jgi:hypothetical protein
MTTERYTRSADLRSAVLSWYADVRDGYDSDNPEGPWEDLAYGGCASGMVSELIYTTDVHQFYADHADEIEELVEELESDMGQPLRSDDYDRRTLFAWTAFEETARRIASERGHDN